MYFYFSNSLYYVNYKVEELCHGLCYRYEGFITTWEIKLYKVGLIDMINNWTLLDVLREGDPVSLLILENIFLIKLIIRVSLWISVPTLSSFYTFPLEGTFHETYVSSPKSSMIHWKDDLRFGKWLNRKKVKRMVRDYRVELYKCNKGLSFCRNIYI